MSSYQAREYTMEGRALSGERASFIRKTYAHLLGAIVLFVAIEALLLNSPLAAPYLEFVFSQRYGWLAVLGGFMVVSWIANKWAASEASLGTQYAGLGLYVFAEAVLFLPLLYVAMLYGGENVIPMAALTTLLLFTGLTGSVFISGKKFSFLGPILAIAGMAAIGLIVCSILFGFSLGILFTAFMILFAGAAVLYHTSNVLHEYPAGQHVAAALALFASVALLFWYILRLLMILNRR